MDTSKQGSPSFFEEDGVENEVIGVGKGVPFGTVRVSNSAVGIGGAYGTWGESCDNDSLPKVLEHQIGAPLAPEDLMELGNLGFVSRHHTPELSGRRH
jgi:hypothetical protein